jgi:aminoglycoside phosphotransferase
LNTILNFLSINWRRWGLGRYGTPGQLSYVALTPRFRASGHVVFLILGEGGSEPVLVAKVARVAGSSASLAREAANLRLFQGRRPDGVDSAPQVIAFDNYLGHSILIESALLGQPMDRPFIRRNLKRCCEVVTDWLAGMPCSEHNTARPAPSGFEQWVEQPLHDFEVSFSASADEAQLLRDTRRLVAPLQDASLPLVFEHGDLCHPNLLLLKDGRLGVLDWELAEPHGLPACDLFFFLNYAAFARRSVSNNRRAVQVFQEAFFGRTAWAWPYIQHYAARLQLSPHLLTPLFVMGWVRYVVGLLTRLGATRQATGILAADAAWLRTNRYYALWQYTIAHAKELTWLHQIKESPTLSTHSAADVREEKNDARLVHHH